MSFESLYVLTQLSHAGQLSSGSCQCPFCHYLMKMNYLCMCSHLRSHVKQKLLTSNEVRIVAALMSNKKGCNHMLECLPFEQIDRLIEMFADKEKLTR